MNRNEITLPDAYSFMVHSDLMDADYKIHVAMPQQPAFITRRAFPERFRVVYATDANLLFIPTASTVRWQASDPDAPVEPLLLVGIGYEFGDDPNPQHTIRHRDLSLPGTPAVPADAEGNFTRTEIPAGRADTFLAFLERELDPLIRKELPCSDDAATYLGVSLGGYFGLYALFNRSPLFDTYIVCSPAMTAEESDPMFDIEAQCRDAGHRLPVRLWMSVGNLERTAAAAILRPIGSNFDRMLLCLRERAYEGLTLAHREYMDATHFNVAQRAIQDALRTFFPGQALI